MRFHESPDPAHLHVNTLPPRAYYLPSPPGAPAYLQDKTAPNMQLLNGDWDFAYFDCPEAVPDALLTGGGEGDEGAGGDAPGDAAWERMPVPAVWQLHRPACEADRPAYINVQYPFPYDPPHVPHANPTGVYRRAFTLPGGWADTRVHLLFEGVDSCHYVYCNGAFVGYSQVSHATSAFDLTPHLRPGGNILTVMVLKYCDGSYLEDQDKFRFSGIFRDVYLLSRPADCLYDFAVTTPLTPEGASVHVALTYSGAPVPVRATLTDAGGAPVADARTTGDALSLPLPAPRLWSAEDPYLYTLTLETPGEAIVTRVGIREVRIADGVLRINGQNVKFRGVNRHDSDPVAGPAVTREHLLRDLTLMKQHNVNAIRTSHYPGTPLLYELCDEYGFYVLDEADVECHGVVALLGSDSHWGKLANDPVWARAFADRAHLLVTRDRNRPCVVIWSMGNEAGYGCGIEAALTETKRLDPTRPTHYESTHGSDAPDFTRLDLHSRMYPHIDEIHKYFAEGNQKPFVLCEYSHAMGNGPGDLEDYWQTGMAHDGFCGGFVWEWCDHALYKGPAENGKPVYHYGGDSGEFPHDGNFCMDGLVYPDRRPHTGLLELKNVQRPLRAALTEADGVRRLALTNTLDFTGTAGYLTVAATVMADGEPIGTWQPPGGFPDVPPHQTVYLPLDEADFPRAGYVHLLIETFAAAAHPLRPAGHPLGFTQLCLCDAPEAASAPPPAISRAPLTVAETPLTVKVSGDGFVYTYNKHTGLFDAVTSHGQALFAAPMDYTLFRAPTDNDRPLVGDWHHARYDRPTVRVYDTAVTADGDGVTLRARAAIAAPSRQRILELEQTWHIDPAGEADYRVEVRKNPLFPPLPRFGLRLFLPDSLSEATYHARGPHENYIDKHQSTYYARFTANAADFHEDYLMPQENGARTGCRRLHLSGGGRALAVTGRDFSFTLSPYTQEQLAAARHSHELTPGGCTVLCLDYKQHGVGSASCGPQLLPPYRFDEEAFCFALHWRL